MPPGGEEDQLQRDIFSWQNPGSESKVQGFYAQPVVAGDRTYLLAPVMRNKSPNPLTLNALRPYHGLRYVDVRAFRVEDFGGAVLSGWNSSIEGALEADDPAKHPSKPVIGVTIPPGKTLVDEQPTRT